MHYSKPQLKICILYHGIATDETKYWRLMREVDVRKAATRQFSRPPTAPTTGKPCLSLP
jgi:hypothetical protein